MKSELILSLLDSPLVAHFLSPDTERLPALQRARHLERVTVAVQPQEKANLGPHAQEETSLARDRGGCPSNCVRGREIFSSGKVSLYEMRLCIITQLYFGQNCHCYLPLYPDMSICAGLCWHVCVHICSHFSCYLDQ